MSSRLQVSQVIQSGNRQVRIDRAGPPIIERLQTWPKGFIRGNLRGQEQYVIVLQDESGEVGGVRFHYAYHKDKSDAERMLSACRILLPTTLQLFRQNEFRGIFLVCPYLLKGNEGWFVGYVFFLHSERLLPLENSVEFDPEWDRTFGPGANTAVAAFLRSSFTAWQGIDLWAREVSVPEVVGRSQCGLLALDYMLVDSDIVCIKAELTDNNPILTQAAAAGIEHMYWLPILTATAQP